MTERSFSGSQHWFGVVTSVMDPDKDGRVQVRIHGRNDDETNISNEKLFWSKPLQPVTSAGHNKIGSAPVGLIVGSTVFGHYLDADQQYPIHIGSISKAGDASDKETSGGSETLKDGTNSAPSGSRLANNSFITRKDKNIKDDDQTQVSYQNNYTPTEQNDNDGRNITKEAIDKTKYANNPSVASLTSLSGSILEQLKQVDPQNINAVLPKAIPAFIKMKDLNSFSSGQGSLGVMGQALGMALQTISGKIGQAAVLNNIASAISNGNMSPTVYTALEQALLNLNSPIVTSDTVKNVIGLSLDQIINLLLPLLQNGGLTLDALENIIALFLQQLQDNGSQAVLGDGATQSNIFNMLSQLLPTIAQPIQTSLNTHFPSSVFDISAVTQALQKFSMNQAFVKAPNNGRKALAMEATSQIIPPNQGTSIGDIVSKVQGVTEQAKTTLGNAFSSVINLGT